VKPQRANGEAGDGKKNIRCSGWGLVLEYHRLRKGKWEAVGVMGSFTLKRDSENYVSDGSLRKSGQAQGPLFDGELKETIGRMVVGWGIWTGKPQ